ncbi:hypothetical protein NDU88_000123 [Pleurodeles waltl]|uniref:Uncharacterized protein n=1 Tax=Pleurodeles waltl TaxID=8319 RepID=A0AAV7S4C5_PLEWA|nr:hypothetical protein NDU88_000123 [Pleurodeles waltl]
MGLMGADMDCPVGTLESGGPRFWVGLPDVGDDVGGAGSVATERENLVRREDRDFCGKKRREWNTIREVDVTETVSGRKKEETTEQGQCEEGRASSEKTTSPEHHTEWRASLEKTTSP